MAAVAYAMQLVCAYESLIFLICLILLLNVEPIGQGFPGKIGLFVNQNIRRILMYVLEAEHLCKSYRSRGKKTEVLQDVSLKIEKGEMVAVMGASGSGKTTLLHILSGIDTPDSGEVFLGGQDLASFAPGQLAIFRRRNLGMVFQDFQLLESLSVEENILLPMVLDRKNREEQERQIGRVMRQMGLGELASRRVTELSGGQKQRVAIARAVIQEPSLIFADEPTGNLDAGTAERILRCMAGLNQRNGSSMVIVTHDAHVASCCHRILRLENGGVS